jgi:hypothetical protein
MDLDPGRFPAAQTEAEIAKPNLHGVAQKGETKDFHLLSFQESHLHQALDQGIVPFQGSDSPALAGL